MGIKKRNKARDKKAEHQLDSFLKEYPIIDTVYGLEKLHYYVNRGYSLKEAVPLIIDDMLILIKLICEHYSRKLQ